MELRNRTTGVIITDGELRLKHPNTSFPSVITAEVLNSFDYDQVLEGAQPTLTAPYQYAQRDGVEEINGQWFTKYIAVEYNAEGKVRIDAEEAERIREIRNKRLVDCDWTQLPDTAADHAGWASYRKELRDITKQSGFPWTVKWPTEPTQK